jgi:hypothetical protein
MAYQLRFESNALDVDNKIGQMLDALVQTTRQVRRAVGVQVREDEVNKLVTLRGVCQRTFELSMDWADKDFDQQMASAKWEWTDKQTRRKNGEIVGSPRDIIDTGALLQSKRRDPINSSITEFTWEDDAAELVHDGGRTKAGGAYPARPWTEPTLDEIDSVIDTVIKKGGR